jgi:hypothetical protein
VLPQSETTQIVPAVFESILENARMIEFGTLICERSLAILGEEGASSVLAQALAGDGLRVFGVKPLIGRVFERDAEGVGLFFLLHAAGEQEEEPRRAGRQIGWQSLAHWLAKR